MSATHQIMFTLEYVNPYLLVQDFEIDYAGPPPGWSGPSGTGVFNYHDTSSPLVGSASMSHFTGNAGNLIGIFTAQDEVWVFFAFELGANAFGYMFDISDSVGTAIISIGIWGLANLRLTGSGHDDFPTFTTTTGTTYYFWLHYKKGTGSNSQFDIYISTTTTKPGSPIASWTNGTSTSQAAQINIDGSDSGMSCQWDYIRVSANPIGSNPT